MLARIQTFIKAGDEKLIEIQVRLNKLPDIFNRYDMSQSELSISDDAHHSGDRELFENQYYQVEAKASKLLHPEVELPRPRHNSSRSSSSERRNTSPRSHGSSVHIQLPVISLPTYELKARSVNLHTVMKQHQNRVPCTMIHSACLRVLSFLNEAHRCSETLRVDHL
jgi:hypothetical protein